MSTIKLHDLETMLESMLNTVDTIKTNDCENYVEQRKALWNLRVLKSITVEMGENLDYLINNFEVKYDMVPRE